MSNRIKLLLSAAAGVMASAHVAQAQESSGTQASSAQASAAQSGEIIVTARKRQESLLKVPVIEQVITAQQLDRAQLDDITDISSLTPGLVLGLASLEIGTQVSIRGIGTTSLDPGIDQSVSLNLDGMQITQGAAYSVGVFDMAQVEVLKGPQALFFGKNSPGGVVSIRTNDPGDELEVIGQFGREFRADEWRGSLIVSGPMTETLGVRAAVLYDNFGGYFHNVATPITALGAVRPNDHIGRDKSLFLRGTMVWKPAPGFTARLKANYTRDHALGGAPYQLTSCPDGTSNYAGIQFYRNSEDCRVDSKLGIVDMNPAAFGGSLPNNGVNFTFITQKFGTLELDGDIAPGLTATSLTGYYNLGVDTMLNGTLTGGAGASLVAIKAFSRKEFTQELRLNSDFSGPLNFSLGGFYQHGRMKNDIDIRGNTILQLPAKLSGGTHDVAIDSQSVFGQLRYKPASQLEISAGARWTHEKRTDDATWIDQFGVVSGAPGTVLPVTGPVVRSSTWSPELTFSYTPTDDLTIFGSLKQGYKSGSYNLIQPVAPGDTFSFGDEKVRGGEIGAKMRTADRQFNANLAVYLYDYKGLQVGINEAAAGGLPVIKTVNAGSARVYGVDFDASYRPDAVPGLQVNAALNWNKAKFADFRGAPCWGGQTIGAGCNYAKDPVTGEYGVVASGGTAQDLTGAPLPRAPKWQITGGANYEFPLGDALKFDLGATVQYSSKYVAILGRRDDFYQGAFAKLGVNLALKSADDAWEVALIGNNLTDKLTTGNCTNLNFAGGQIIPGAISGQPTNGPSGVDEVVCTFNRGREVWLRLTIRPAGLLGR